MEKYYIIGSQYDFGRNGKSNFSEMKKQSVVSIGFTSVDLTSMLGKSVGVIKKHLISKGEDYTPHKKDKDPKQIECFLNLKEGDIIAIKKSYNFKTGDLVIIGYAKVKSKNGVLYSFDPQGLKHKINVEFIETDFEKTFRIPSYSLSIQKVKEEHIDEMFYGVTNTSNSVPTKKTGSSKPKDTSEKHITGTFDFIKQANHNKIQNGIYEIIADLYGEDCVKKEENFVDIVVTIRNTTELIEVKPYNSATQCIREGLGQLLNYYHKHYSNRKNVTLIIFGNKEPNADDKTFIKFIQSTLNLKFRYDSWERHCKG